MAIMAGFGCAGLPTIRLSHRGRGVAVSGIMAGLHYRLTQLLCVKWSCRTVLILFVSNFNVTFHAKSLQSSGIPLERRR